MKDFLYSFWITKLYRQIETLFYISKEIEIKIEILNGLIGFFLKFPILGMFKNRISYFFINSQSKIRVKSKLYKYKILFEWKLSSR